MVRSRKAVITKRIVLGELPDLLEALDRGEFTQEKQQQISEGVTMGRASWSDYGHLPTDFEDEDGCPRRSNCSSMTTGPGQSQNGKTIMMRVLRTRKC